MTTAPFSTISTPDCLARSGSLALYLRDDIDERTNEVIGRRYIIELDGEELWNNEDNQLSRKLYRLMVRAFEEAENE